MFKTDLDGLVSVGLLLVLAYAAGRLANRAGLPKISGYLAAGILLGPSVMGVLSSGEVAQELSWITRLSLCIIGYSIGGSLEYRKLKHLGRSILWITGLQALGALLLTTAAMLLALPLLIPGLTAHKMAAAAVLVGAISVATAPGAVLAVISETRARGPFTNTLLGVVALDDGVTLVLFALAASVARLLTGQGSGEAWTAAWEICGSVAMGLVAGWAVKLMGAGIYDRETLLMTALGTLTLVAGISPDLHISPILASMVAGAFIVNFEKRHNLFYEALDSIEATVFGLFFALAGAHLKLNLFLDYFALSMLLLVARFAGKQAGVWAGAAISSPSSAVRRYLGIGLFPQAGVTVGLVLLAEGYLPGEMGGVVVSFVVGAVVINELISPPLLKLCLRLAGETEV